MFCSKCGNNLPDTAKFCDKCGNPVRSMTGKGEHATYSLNDKKNSKKSVFGKIAFYAGIAWRSALRVRSVWKTGTMR